MHQQSAVRTPRASTAPVLLDPEQPRSDHLTSRTRALITSGAAQLRSIDDEDAREFLALKSP